MNRTVAPPWCLHCEGSLYEDEILAVEVKMPSSGERFTYHHHCLPGVARTDIPNEDKRAVLDLFERLTIARQRRTRGH